MLKAGTARRDVSNRKPLFLVGYPHVPRVSTGIHDPLWATALYLEDGGRGILSVAVDILFIHHQTARVCRDAIAQRTGLTRERILLSATHTHSGPVTSAMLSWREDPTVPAADPEYMQDFQNGIIEAGCAAVAAAVPAELAVTRAHSTGVGGNRLSAEGTRDPEVGLIMVRRAADHAPLALQLVYAMHPTVLHEDSRLVSSDFPHYTRQTIEAAFPGVQVLYHNGPCGNLSPRYHVRGQTFAEAERLGALLGQQACAALAQLKAADFRTTAQVDGATARVELPPRRFCSAAEAEAELHAARAEYERLRQNNAPHGPLRTAECTVFGAEERVVLAQAQEAGETAALLRDYNPVEVQVLRIGDTWLACWPGECFVEYALAMKAAAPGTFVVSLANGELQGYIPTPEATGYEARLSFFEPAAGERLVAATVGLVRQLQAP
jgi:neutral ceramidase